MYLIKIMIQVEREEGERGRGRERKERERKGEKREREREFIHFRLFRIHCYVFFVSIFFFLRIRSYHVPTHIQTGYVSFFMDLRRVVPPFRTQDSKKNQRLNFEWDSHNRSGSPKWFYLQSLTQINRGRSKIFLISTPRDPCRSDSWSSLRNLQENISTTSVLEKYQIQINHTMLRVKWWYSWNYPGYWYHVYTCPSILTSSSVASDVDQVTRSSRSIMNKNDYAKHFQTFVLVLDDNYILINSHPMLETLFPFKSLKIKLRFKLCLRWRKPGTRGKWMKPSSVIPRSFIQ